MHQRTHDLVQYMSRFHEVTVIHNPSLDHSRQRGHTLLSMGAIASGLLSLFLRPLHREVVQKNKTRIMLAGTFQPFSMESEMPSRRNGIFRALIFLLQPFFQIFLIVSPLFAFFMLLRPRKYDVCIAEGPWAGLASIALRRRSRVRKVVYEDLDFFPAYAGISSKNRLGYYLTHWIERNAVKKADLVVSVGSLLAKLRRLQGAKQVRVLGNGYSRAFLKLAPDLTTKTVVYAGALTDWSGVETLISAVKLASELVPELRLLVVGDGPERSSLENFALASGMSSRVEFVGKVTYEEVGDILAKASIGAAVFVPSALTKYSVMCKLMDYLGVGLPVLVTDFGENSSIVREAGAGLCVEYRSESISEGLIELMKNPKLLKECSERAKKISLDRDWDTILAEEREVIEKMQL